MAFYKLKKLLYDGLFDTPFEIVCEIVECLIIVVHGVYKVECIVHRHIAVSKELSTETKSIVEAESFAQLLGLSHTHHFAYSYGIGVKWFAPIVQLVHHIFLFEQGIYIITVIIIVIIIIVIVVIVIL